MNYYNILKIDRNGDIVCTYNMFINLKYVAYLEKLEVIPLGRARGTVNLSNFIEYF